MAVYKRIDKVRHRAVSHFHAAGNLATRSEAEPYAVQDVFLDFVSIVLFNHHTNMRASNINASNVTAITSHLGTRLACL